MTTEPARWVFGYGSLMWRAEFPFVAREASFIEGFCRRFWQGSTDHRGGPQAPGRVVTLVPQVGARCWGIAYGIDRSELEPVLEALDERECGGYTRHEVPLFLAGGERVASALAYFATPGNPNYLGPAPLSEIAAQVLASHGPSGPNPDYVLRLDAAIAALGADDEHVRSLAELVRAGLQPASSRCASARR